MSQDVQHKNGLLGGMVTGTAGEASGVVADAVDHIVAHLTSRTERPEMSNTRYDEAVAVLDMDAMRFVDSACSRTITGTLLSGSYYTFCIATLENIHPDDRENFTRVRGPEALQADMRARRQGVACPYRYMVDGEYHPLQSRVFFSFDGQHPMAVVVIRDTTGPVRVETGLPGLSHSHEESCAEIYEIDLLTDRCSMRFSSTDVLIPVDVDPAANIVDVAANLVHPDDRGHFIGCMNGKVVSKAFADGAGEVSLEYRRLGMDGSWHWISSVVVPMRGPEGELESRAMLFNRDVTQNKQEEQHRRITERYDRALRNIYDEVYELNVTRNSYKILYHIENKYVIPPKDGILTEAVSLVAHSMIHPQDHIRFLEFFDLERLRTAFASGEEFCTDEFRKLWVDGWFHWAMLTVFPVERMGNEDEIYLVFIMDVDERRRNEEVARQNAVLERQRLADERYKIIVDQTRTQVFEWSADPDVRYVSPALGELFDGVYDERDVLRVWREDGIVHPEDQVVFKDFLENSLSGEHVEMTVRLRTRSGDFIWVKVGLSCMRGRDGAPDRYVGTLNDVDAATRSVQALKYRAEYDTLTGILNMQTFYSRAEQLIRNNPESQYYVIRMDIDRFKVINDLFGIEEGDRLLKSIAASLDEGMNANSVCARMSGDVFCACVDFSRGRLIEFVTRLMERMAAYPLTSRIVPSFGICRVDNVETPVSVLCDWANLALKTVKGQVLNFYAFYDETLRERLLEERKIESRMHDALLNGEFCLYLQPKVDIQTSTIVGAEALVRWKQPQEGIIAPDSFIPLFERNGFIIQLDEYIWEETCKVLRSWIDNGLEPIPVSVNVSRMHIHDTRFCEKLPRLLANYRLPPHLLELELTESVFLDNADQLIAAINKLRTHGFVFSLDDFGAGYSSLNILKSLPIEIIKIDRGFLTEVVATDRGKTVIRHIISLARALNMQVVAEGVENQDQAAFLLEVNCGLAQGYHYSRPIPVPDFEKMAFGPDY